MGGLGERERVYRAFSRRQAMQLRLVNVLDEKQESRDEGNGRDRADRHSLPELQEVHGMKQKVTDHHMDSGWSDGHGVCRSASGLTVMCPNEARRRETDQKDRSPG